MIDSSPALLLKFNQKNGLCKTQALFYNVTEIFQPTFVRQNAGYQFLGTPSLFSDMLQYFKGVSDITMIITPNVLQFQSFQDVSTVALGM